MRFTSTTQNKGFRLYLRRLSDHFANLCAKLHMSCHKRSVRSYQVPPMATLTNTNVYDYRFKGAKIGQLAVSFLGRMFVP